MPRTIISFGESGGGTAGPGSRVQGLGLRTPDPTPQTPNPAVALSRIRRELVEIDVEVRPDLLDVVELLERLDQLQQRLGVLPLELDGRLGDHRDLRLARLDPLRFERGLHGVKVGRRRGDDELVAVALDVLRA